MKYLVCGWRSHVSHHHGLKQTILFACQLHNKAAMALAYASDGPKRAQQPLKQDPALRLDQPRPATMKPSTLTQNGKGLQGGKPKNDSITSS